MSGNRWLGVFSLAAAACVGMLAPAAPGQAAASSSLATGDNLPLRQFFDRVRPALVAVQYQLDAELAKHQLIGSGIVIREDGLVMIPMALSSLNFPDAQMKNFKIIIPRQDEDQQEVDATFVGRDERSEVAFVQAKGDRKWTAIHFEDVPLAVGQPLYGVGLLPKSAGYQAYLAQGTVAARLRGEVPQVMITGGLGNVGSPVFDAQFRAVGYVQPQEGEEILLDSRNDLSDILVPPHFFVPTSFFQQSLSDPPTGKNPLRLAWIGVPAMNGVNDQLATFLGLKNQPAVQVGDIVPGAPAAKAGLEAGNIIIKINGKPLERGDLPEELPMIFRRQLLRMKIGDKVTFTVLPEKGVATREITVTLEARPKQPSQAERFYAQDLGFVAREAVFADTYTHKLKPDAAGAVVDVIRRDGAAATAKLAPEDWIMQLNGQPVTSVGQFKTDYQAYRKDHPHDAVVLVVHRVAGQEETVNIEPPQTDAAPGGAEQQ